MAKKIEMIGQQAFFGHIFSSLKSIFIFFEAERYNKEISEELKDLKEFVTLNYKEVCDWGYSNPYTLYRITPLAAQEEILNEIIPLAERMAGGDCENTTRLLSKNLWMLMYGWNRDCQFELFLCLMGIKLEVAYKSVGSERAEKEKCLLEKLRKYR